MTYHVLPEHMTDESTICTDTQSVQYKELQLFLGIFIRVAYLGFVSRETYSPMPFNGCVKLQYGWIILSALCECHYLSMPQITKQTGVFINSSFWFIDKYCFGLLNFAYAASNHFVKLCRVIGNLILESKLVIFDWKNAHKMSSDKWLAFCAGHNMLKEVCNHTDYCQHAINIRHRHCVFMIAIYLNAIIVIFFIIKFMPDARSCSNSSAHAAEWISSYKYTGLLDPRLLWWRAIHGHTKDSAKNLST